MMYERYRRKMFELYCMMMCVIYVYFHILDMFDALCGDMMSRMIA